MVVNGRSTMRADAGKGPGVIAGASTSRSEGGVDCRGTRQWVQHDGMAAIRGNTHS